MRILFISSSDPFPAEGIGGYCGGGWISSLIKLAAGAKGMTVGVTYASTEQVNVHNANGIGQMPVYIKPLSGWQKVKLYYGGYKHLNYDEYINGALKTIGNFKPDVVHLFGMENPFASVLGHTDIPFVCHLQGLLTTYDNAFFPIGMNESSFHWPPTKREWLLRNGYLYAKKSIHIRGEWEKKLFHRLQYAMGRTEWDKEVSQLLAPQSQYFHVDEVLRQPFYDHAGEWKLKQGKKMVIVSTLSETIYKGLDLVLKTAKLLKEETSIDFEWNIIGIGKGSNFVSFFERSYGIKSKEVNVYYLGVKSPYEIIRLLKGASIYVHTSYIDNSPNSICEAQMIGCPVVATNVGGIPSLVTDGETGLLVPANAPFELAYKLKALANNHELSEKISDAEKEHAAKRHDTQNILCQLINTYCQIIEDAKDF